LTRAVPEKDHKIRRNTASARVPAATAVNGRGHAIDARSIRKQLPQALRSRDLVAGNLAVAEILAGLNKDNIGAALRVFEDAPGSFRTDSYFRLFMHAWGKVDGQAAVEYALSDDRGRRVRGAGMMAIGAWAGADPLAAQDFLASLDADRRTQQYLTEGLVRGWSETDLAGATAFVDGMGDSGEQGRYVYLLASQYMSQEGTRGAFRWAESAALQHAGTPYLSQIVNSVTVEVARRDPEEAAAWIDRNADNEALSSRAFAEVADELAERDPVAASQWLDKYFDDERVNARVVGEMTREWARSDAAAAAEWVSQHAGSEKIDVNVVSSISRQWAEDEPLAAIEWLDTLNNDTLMIRGLASVVDRWANQDATAAGDWLNTIDRDATYDPVVESYANRVAYQSPQLAMIWAREIEDAERSERTTIRVAQVLYRQDPQVVRDWLPASGLSEEAQNAILNPRSRGWGWGGRGRR